MTNKERAKENQNHVPELLDDHMKRVYGLVRVKVDRNGVTIREFQNKK